MNLPILTQILSQAGFTSQEYQLHAPLQERTWFKVGGSADVLVTTKDLEKIQRLLALANTHQAPTFFLGDGSNLVVSDAGIAGFVIDTKGLAQESPTIKEAGEYRHLYAPAGILMEDLVRFSIHHESSSLLHFFGLPGTLGGALFMNARCYDGEIADLQPMLYGVDPTGKEVILPYQADEWDYKISPVQHSMLLLTHARLLINRTDTTFAALKHKANSFKTDRTKKGHFAYPCAGSTFKNNRNFGKPSGQIIDECQLKGLSVGGASISDYHANIVINQGSATAADIYTLVQIIQKEVKRQKDFFLEPEILFVGRGYTQTLP